MASSASIPTEHTALVFHSTAEPLQITKLPVPKATPGSAIMQVIATGVISYAGEVLSGKRNYPYPSPYVPGSASVGRIVAVGNDATTLVAGDLVMSETFLRGRDNPNALCLHGIHQGGTDKSKRLVEHEFRDSTFAEYAKVPLENIIKLPEDGPSPQQWLNMSRMLIPFGGLTSDGGLDLKPGEKVVVAPATGQFGGSAVEVALAMGASVVALGRNVEALAKLEKGLSDYCARLKTVKITGDVQADTQAIGPVDCYFDISPPAAAKSTHVHSCFLALKPKGRVCLMGWVQFDLSMAHGKVMRESITITGKWMYEQNALRKVLQMVESGILRLDRLDSRAFPLEQWKEALDHAAVNNRWGQATALVPSQTKA